MFTEQATYPVHFAVDPQQYVQMSAPRMRLGWEFQASTASRSSGKSRLMARRWMTTASSAGVAVVPGDAMLTWQSLLDRESYRYSIGAVQGYEDAYSILLPVMRDAIRGKGGPAEHKSTHQSTDKDDDSDRESERETKEGIERDEPGAGSRYEEQGKDTRRGSQNDTDRPELLADLEYPLPTIKQRLQPVEPTPTRRTALASLTDVGVSALTAPPLQGPGRDLALRPPARRVVPRVVVSQQTG